MAQRTKATVVNTAITHMKLSGSSGEPNWPEISARTYPAARLEVSIRYLGQFLEENGTFRMLDFEYAKPGRQGADACC